MEDPMMLHPERKSSLTAAFEALGPDRVARGLEAHGHDWSNCFLAIALGGERGALARQLEGRWRQERVVADMLRVRVQVISEVVKSWDHDEATFRELAAQWLESNRMSRTPALPVAEQTMGVAAG
jgi:hypothetical protein